MSKSATAMLTGVDLTTLSPAALDELAKAIEKEKKAARMRELDQVKSKIKKVLDDAGLAVGDLAHLFPFTQRRPASSKPAPFRHPSNPALTWTGKGRKPQWVTAWLGDGGTLDQLKAL